MHNGAGHTQRRRRQRRRTAAHRTVLRRRTRAHALWSCAALFVISPLVGADPAPSGAPVIALPAPGGGSPAPSGAPVTGTTTTTIAPGVPAPAPLVVTDSCENYCDVGQSPGGCFCDENCAANGDCCADQAVFCSVTTTTTQTLPLGTCSGGDNFDVNWEYEVTHSQLTLIAGDTVTFTYSGTHTVMALASKEAFDNCDFTGALFVGGNAGNSPFELCTADFAPGTYYLACNVGSHCLYGNMKQEVRVTRIGTELQDGLIEYFPEGNLTCAAGDNRLTLSSGITLGECYGLCLDRVLCNFVSWHDADSRCVLYRDCSNRCETSSGTDCVATAELRRTLTGETATTYAVSAGLATCTYAVNDYALDVFVNNENVTSYVSGDRYDDDVVKTFSFTHFKQTIYTLAFSGQDSTPESCFDPSSFVVTCSSTDSTSAWNAVFSHPGLFDAYAIDNETNPDVNWYSSVDTIPGTARYTYNDSHWGVACDSNDNFWVCTDCINSGTGKAGELIWGCDDTDHPCLNYGFFRLTMYSSAYDIKSDYSTNTCPVADLLLTRQGETLNDCYRECARNSACTFFFYSTEEDFTVTGLVCRLYGGNCRNADLETADEPGVIFEMLESCHDGVTNQDELYVDCGGLICDQCDCEPLEYGNSLIDGGCAPCTALNECASGQYFNGSYCLGNETLDADLNYVVSTDDTCRNCTAVGDCEVFYFWSNATGCGLGDGTVDDACQPCTANGECDQYFYYDAARCQGDTTIDDTCVACQVDGLCAVGQFFDPLQCNGTGTVDSTCQDCEYTTAGVCPVGQYHDPTSCQGDLAFDDSCTPCTLTGACPVGNYFDATACQGNGLVDDSCQSCTASGACAAGTYFDSTFCDGTSVSDDQCQSCTPSGACPAGTYFDAAFCTGTGTSDDQCQPCTPSGSCAPGEYYDSSFCTGTGTSDDQCQLCTTTGNCPVGSYFEVNSCAGDTEVDDACVACTVNGSCPDLQYWDATQCLGTGTSDNACVPCTLTGSCPTGFFFDPSKCKGTGDTDDACQPCTSTGNCAAGTFFDSTRCLGDLRVDDSCQPCTEQGECPSGFYFEATNCQGAGTTDDACVPCTSVGSCPSGYYHAGCDGTGNVSDASCVLCSTSCDVGQYVDASLCDGTGSVDSCTDCTGGCSAGEYHNATACDGTGTSDTSCILCTSAGNCPSGFYHDAAQCPGSGLSDSTCVACVTAGNCPAGAYHDASSCDGSSSTDGCVTCTAQGACPSGSYFDSTACQGDGTTDSCALCSASGSCPSGYYFDGSACDGTGTVDDACQACTAFEECAAGTYYSFSQCDGTGTSDDVCLPCTAAGACPVGQFYSAETCDGSGASDTSCQDCTPSGFCPYGYYHDASLCDGTGTVDTCVACTEYGSCADDTYYNADACDGSSSSDSSCVPCTASCPAGQFANVSHCRTSEILPDLSVFNTAVSDWCADCPEECDPGFYYDAALCPAGSSSLTGEFTAACVACDTSCSAGEYLAADYCLGFGTSNDKCQPCAAAGECPDGSYYDVGLATCDGTGTNALDSCLPCTVAGTCSSGFFFNVSSCDGTSSSDNSCSPCTASGDCPAGTYFHATGCTGLGFGDDTCVTCTVAGKCAVGEYHQPCDGTGSTDSCTACAGTCTAGFYYDEASCPGTESVDNGCQACTATGNCKIGFYFDATACDGTTTSDIACQPCVSGGCSALSYNAGCDGTGTSAAVCVSCTTAGSCPVGYYFDAAACDGSTDRDSSCVACSDSCVQGQFVNPNNCQGTLSSDDACDSCAAADANCDTCMWSLADNAPRCTACLTGYSLLQDYSCADTTVPVLSPCPTNQALTVVTGASEVVTWTDPTATDSLDGAVTPVCDFASGSSFATPSVTTVTCTATDAAGNAASCSFLVTINDAVAPTIDNCPSSIDTDTAYAASTAVVTWTAVTASDTSDSAVDVVCTNNPGDSFDVGVTAVVCIATDDGGNTATCTFDVSVTARGTTLSPDVWGDETTADALTRIETANAASGVCTFEGLLSGLSRCLVNTQQYADCETAAMSCLVLTGIIDGPNAGGTPKAIELYVACDIADLSAYGLGLANNGGGTDGQEYTFDPDPATAGSFIYVSSDSTEFQSFFGFLDTYNSGSVVNFNGDDAMEVYHNGLVVDMFGDVSGDSDSQGWSYEDGWAYKNSNTGNNAAIFGGWVGAAEVHWDLDHKNDLDPFTTNADVLVGLGENVPFGTYAPEDFDPCVNVIDRDSVASIYVQLFFNDASFDSNSILAFEDGNVSFYVLRMENPEARAAIRAESFTVPGYQTASPDEVPIDSFVLSSLPDTVVLMTVTVFRMGTSGILSAVNFDTALVDLFDSYIVVVIDKFASDGSYVPDALNIDLCLASLDTTLTFGVYHLANTDAPSLSKWEEVTNFVPTGSNCYSITTETSTLAFGIVGDSDVAQAVPRKEPASSSFMFDVFQKQNVVDNTTSSVAQECGEGYFGFNCAQRRCPVGLDLSVNSFQSTIDEVYTPGNANNQGFHSYAECSNAGTCDRRLGVCSCADGIEGSACQRRSCPLDRRGRACSQRGRCLSNYYAVSGEHAPDAEFDSFGRVTWNDDGIMGCVCDPGYTGSDCSKYRCPYGPDPSLNSSKYARDIQTVDVSGLAAESHFVLQYKDYLGHKYNTYALPKEAAADQLRRALVALPNDVIPSVTVTRGDSDDTFRVTFDDAATLGEQALLECNPTELAQLCESGYQRKFVESGTCTTAHDGPTEVGSPVFDGDSEYMDMFECSRQGICSYKTGACSCFAGFQGLGCQQRVEYL